MQGTSWEPIPGRWGVHLKTAVHLPKREESTVEPTRGDVKEKTKIRWKIMKEDIKKIWHDSRMQRVSIYE